MEFTEVQYLREGENKVFRFKLPLRVDWRGYSFRFIHEKEMATFERLLRHYTMANDSWVPIRTSFDTTLSSHLWSPVKVLLLRASIGVFMVLVPAMGYLLSADWIVFLACLGSSVVSGAVGLALLRRRVRSKWSSCQDALETSISTLNTRFRTLEPDGKIELALNLESHNVKFAKIESLTISVEEIYVWREPEAKLSVVEASVTTTKTCEPTTTICEDCRRLKRFTQNEGLSSLTTDLCVCARKDREEFQQMLAADLYDKGSNETSGQDYSRQMAARCPDSAAEKPDSCKLCQTALDQTPN